MNKASSLGSMTAEILASGARHVAGIVCGIATVALVAHRLGPASLGAWTLLGSTSFLLGLSDLGLSTAVARAVAAGDRPRARRAVGLSLWVIAVLSPVFALLSLGGITSACADADGRGPWHAALVILVVVASGLAGAVAFPYRAFALMGGAVRGLAGARAAGATVQIAGVAAGLAISRSLLAPAVALLLGALAETAIVVRAARALDPDLPLGPRRPESARALRERLREGSATLALNVAVILAIRVDVVILARVSPLAAVAGYGVAARAVDQCFALAKQVSAALQSRLGAAETRREAAVLATPLLFGLVAGGLTALAVDGRALLTAWAGSVVGEPTFAIALHILAAAACLASISEVACSTLTLAAPSPWEGALPVVLGSAINLTISVGGAPWLGAWAVAGGTLAGNVVTTTLAWRRAMPFLGFSRRDVARALAPGFASAAGALGVGLLLADAARTGALASLACAGVATLSGLVAAAVTGHARIGLRRRAHARVAAAEAV